MSLLVTASAASLVYLANLKFSAAMYDITGQRLRTSAVMVASMLGSGLPRREADVLRMARNPSVVGFLRTGSNDGAVISAIDLEAVNRIDSTGWRVQLHGHDGSIKLEIESRINSASASWSAKRIRAGGLKPGHVEISPITDVGGVNHFEFLAPVVDESSRVLGYISETRVISANGQEALRNLIGAGTTLMVGDPATGLWSDLKKTVAGPPAGLLVDTVIVFQTSARGPGIGVTERVAGTPWYLWLQQPKKEVLAPVRSFTVSVVPLAALIALVATLGTWMVSRRLTRRITRLKRKVDAFEGGSGTPLDQDSESDDIDRLESSFERMGARLNKNRELENQVRHAQKLEALGRLAGGVAHDFNNILTVIRNYTELVRMDLPGNESARRDLQEVLNASDRAAGLTRQLLAFSRNQIISPRVLDLNDLISGTKRMLERLVPSNIALEIHLDPEVEKILADPGQIDQVLMNLTVNAVDAMPTGGKITIRTQNAVLDNTFMSRHGYAPPANYVCLTVNDTGHGMDKETLAKIFDPFYTTKPAGKGTGLGLATVYGIVKQNHGYLWVYSEPRRGATFRIYFPMTSAAGESKAAPSVPAPSEVRARGDETVLLVEDDADTRGVTRRVLTQNGYHVIEAANAASALQIVRSPENRINLVVTDFMMPGLTGIEMAAEIATIRGPIPLLVMSGYTEESLAQNVKIPHHGMMIEKPFTAAGLVSAVRTVLDFSAEKATTQA